MVGYSPEIFSSVWEHLISTARDWPSEDQGRQNGKTKTAMSSGNIHRKEHVLEQLHVTNNNKQGSVHVDSMVSFTVTMPISCYVPTWVNGWMSGLAGLVPYYRNFRFIEGNLQAVSHRRGIPIHSSSCRRWAVRLRDDIWCGVMIDQHPPALRSRLALKSIAASLETRRFHWCGIPSATVNDAGDNTKAIFAQAVWKRPLSNNRALSNNLYLRYHFFDILILAREYYHDA